MFGTTRNAPKFRLLDQLDIQIRKEGRRGVMDAPRGALATIWVDVAPTLAQPIRRREMRSRLSSSVDHFEMRPLALSGRAT